MNKLKGYIPILASKEGEFKAIHYLNGDALNRLTPLFDINRLPLKTKKTFDQHIEKIIGNFYKYCDSFLFLLDYSRMDLSWRMESGEHPLLYLCNKLHEKGLNFIPVFGLDRDEGYLFALKNYLEGKKIANVCLRLLSDDLDDLDELKVEIKKKLDFLNLEPEQCDLLVDFKTIEADQVDPIIEVLSQVNLIIPFNIWRSFVLGASSFPEDMSNIKKDSHESIRRVENDLWLAVLMAEPLIGRRPLFADYCVNNPMKPEVDATTMRAVAKIRYATREAWEVFRGHSLQKGDKYAQYFDLSKTVIDSEYYLGSGYSWGDAKIKQCAVERKKTGNLPTWIQIDTNHHLTVIGEHVASFDVS